MDMRIIKKNVCYCVICNDVKVAKDAWDNEQKSLVESGKQEEAKEFPGVSGYVIKDAGDYSYLSTDICENCLRTLIKGVDIINSQNLTGVSLNKESK